jgi:CBS domain-containing protein
MLVKEIMKKAVTVSSSAIVKEAAQTMVKDNIGSLIVIDKGKLTGIITERDILKYFSNSGSPGASISKIMSRNVKTIELNEEIEDAAAIMSQNKIKRLPVTQKGKLVGIITATDLVANSESFDEPFFF